MLDTVALRIVGGFTQHGLVCIQEVAETFSCGFFDASSVVSSSEHDGIHLDADSHRRLGLALKLEVEAIIFDGE